MRIGEVAKLSGTASSRIRFYEGRGLLPAPQRRDNGYRSYPPSVIATLRFINDAQALGFSLREIGAAIPARVGERVAADAIVPALQRKLAEVEAHIATARARRGRLLTLLAEQRDCIGGAAPLKASIG